MGPSDHDLMIFTLSKLTGHAGMRFGWPVIKDKDVYDKVMNYIQLLDFGISKDTQLRVLKLLKLVVESDGKPFFDFAYNMMKDRWDKLTPVFSKSSRFSIQQRHPLQCNFFNAGNIIGRSGSNFSAKDRYVRLSLIK
ncbi:tryptophan aminotransferase-related protein 3-like protein, partial [Tanacetum coccineum]